MNILEKGFYYQADVCSVFITVDGNIIKRIILIKDNADLKEKFQRESCLFEEFPIPELISCFKKYFYCEPVKFNFKCDLSSYTPLEQKILSIVRDIPYSQTMTYEEVAEKIGNKNLRRMVGRTVAKNLFPIVIPCHRVVGKNGNLTGFTADGGVSLKKILLDMER